MVGHGTGDHRPRARPGRYARRLAAEDARRRAEEYAGALGLAIEGIAWVAEPGLRRGEGSGGHSVQTAGLAYAAAGGGAEDEVINVTPDEMTVQASVEVGFSFRRPTGSGERGCRVRRRSGLPRSMLCE